MASTVDIDRLAEKSDTPAQQAAKVVQLAALINAARRVVFYTGAGVSTSAGIGDYRGPTGVWTTRRRKELEALVAKGSATNTHRNELAAILKEVEKKEKDAATATAAAATSSSSSPAATTTKEKKADKKLLSMDAQPTLSHLAQYTLIKNGKAHRVVTTNLDGVYRKAGIREPTLVCLHGDNYIERCSAPACAYQFERNYHVRQREWGVHQHSVPDPCSKCGSVNARRGDGIMVTSQSVNMGTRDTHINFGESLDDNDLLQGEEACRTADPVIIAGTSMSLRHITHMPWLNKKAKVVMINLQPTPDDHKCHLRIWGKCDPIFDALMTELKMPIEVAPIWYPKDAIAITKILFWVAPKYQKAAVRLHKFTLAQEKEAKARQSHTSSSSSNTSSPAVAGANDDNEDMDEEDDDDSPAPPAKRGRSSSDVKAAAAAVAAAKKGKKAATPVALSSLSALAAAYRDAGNGGSSSSSSSTTTAAPAVAAVATTTRTGSTAKKTAKKASSKK